MKKYAIVGAGSRGLNMYAIPLYERFKDVAKIVGVYDPNYKRAEILRQKAGANFKTYKSFDIMIKESKPDVVIIATTDRYHHEYIIKALEAGCDAITEKPMTIDADKCNAILEAEKKSNKKVIVTFNLRCVPFSTKIKELIKNGIIGEILNINFEWILDTVHGADYFRRWHRNLKNSGGLLVHKATHHFDIINWFIEQEPVSVNAFGTLKFYGSTRDERSERCLTCNHKKECEYYIDITQGEFKELYYECEDIDGYYRDKCVFSEEIDIYDSMILNVKYSKGTIMSYSLTAHSPYEGYKLSINGTNGRIEAETYSSRAKKAFAGATSNNLRLYNRENEEIKIKVPVLSGDHGGSDEILQKLLFVGGEDPLNYIAGTKAGAMSLIIGASANISIKEGKTIQVKDLLNKIY